MSYDARIDEIRSLVDPLQISDSTQGLAEYKALVGALDDYEKRRNHLFEELETIVDGDNASDAWKSQLVEGRSGLHEIFGEALRDVETPTLDALGLVTKVVYEEEMFYDFLGAAEHVALAMDEIAIYRSALVAGIEILEEIWSRTEAEAKAVMRDEDTVAEEIEKVLEEAASEAAKLYMTSKETALDIAKNDSAIELITAAVGAIFNVDLSNLGELLVEITKRGAEQIEALSATMELREARFQKYFKSHIDSVLVTFKDDRETAKKFAEDYDYQRVMDIAVIAQKSLSDLESNGTPGQKSDAMALSSVLQRKLESACENAKEEWDSFVEKNQIKFFGPLGPDLDKALLGSARWDPFYSTITSNNLQELLKKWVDENRELAQVIDQTDAPESWKPGLRERLIDSLKDFAKTEEEYANNHGTQALEKYHREEFEKLLDKFKELG